MNKTNKLEKDTLKIKVSSTVHTFLNGSPILSVDYTTRADFYLAPSFFCSLLAKKCLFDPFGAFTGVSRLYGQLPGDDSNKID